MLRRRAVRKTGRPREFQLRRRESDFLPDDRHDPISSLTKNLSPRSQTIKFLDELKNLPLNQDHRFWPVVPVVKKHEQVVDLAKEE